MSAFYFFPLNQTHVGYCCLCLCVSKINNLNSYNLAIQQLYTNYNLDILYNSDYNLDYIIYKLKQTIP
jgi:hypothetical protein